MVSMFSSDGRSGQRFKRNHSEVILLESAISDLRKSTRFALYNDSLRAYLDMQLSQGPSGSRLVLLDPALNSSASCCTQVQVASLYALNDVVNGTGELEIADGLMNDVADRRLGDGGFAIPYNRGPNDPSLADVAELGAAADSLYFLALCGSEVAHSVLVAGAEYILANLSRERPGAVYKNYRTLHADVLNGDIYGSLVLARAHAVTGEDRYLVPAMNMVSHVSSRFRPSLGGGWWPYMEDWNGQILVGNSLAYQATIVAFGRGLSSHLDEAEASVWDETLTAAMNTVVREMGHGPWPHNEVPSWTRDWEHVWEIYLALSGEGGPRALRYLEHRLERLDAEVVKRGAEAWSPISTTTRGKSPITSQFRKCASFSAAMISWLMQTTFTQRQAQHIEDSM